MARIVDNLRRVQDTMENNDTVAPVLGPLLKNAAIAGIRGGVKSAEWKTYMSMFADSQAQLDLLTTETPPADKDWLPEIQAYTLSNSICAPHTNTATGNGILG